MLLLLLHAAAACAFTASLMTVRSQAAYTADGGLVR
jgi:hypothetical protein